MKQLPLREVMHNLGITVTKDGYELSNPAGTARYDLHGVRTTVSGIPEYFPITLSVKGDYVPVVGDQPTTEESIGTMTLGINVDSAALSGLENQLMRIADLCERIQKTQHLGEPAEYVGQSTYTISAGQVFLCDAQVRDAVIGNTILSSELANERQDYIKREVQAIIERELQAGGKLWQVTRGR